MRSSVNKTLANQSQTTFAHKKVKPSGQKLKLFEKSMRLDMIQNRKNMLEKKYGDIVRLHSPVNHVEHHFMKRDTSTFSRNEFSAGRMHSTDRISKNLNSTRKRPSRD